jgi:hypothetical protein
VFDLLLARCVLDVAAGEPVGAADGREHEMQVELRGDVDQEPALGELLLYAPTAERHRDAEHSRDVGSRLSERVSVGQVASSQPDAFSPPEATSGGGIRPGSVNKACDAAMRVAVRTGGPRTVVRRPGKGP